MLDQQVIDHLRIVPDEGRGRFWYLATPYTAHPAGLDVAYRQACRMAARLIRCKVPVFSPIAHSHPIALVGGIDPRSHAIWLPADKPLMQSACGVIVAMLPGWQDSFGISEEVKAFRLAEKPVLYMMPDNEVLGRSSVEPLDAVSEDQADLEEFTR